MTAFFISSESETEIFMKNKAYFPYLLAAILLLSIELLIGNFSTLRSLFYQETDLTPMLEASGTLTETENGYLAPDGTFTLSVPSLNLDIKNLHLDISLPEDTALYYTISLTDEGNYYPYSLPTQGLINAVSSTAYINLHPYGNVTSLQIDFELPADTEFSVNRIAVNAHRPFMPNYIRMLVLYLLFVFFYLLRPSGKAAGLLYAPKSKCQNRITLTIIILLIFSGFFLTQSNKLFTESSKQHHQQYKELAEALCDGRLYIDDEPSEGLLQAANPYDTIYLQANGISYKADYAYFEGRYYVYFGLIPELLLYLPCYLLTGKLLPNKIAVFCFYAVFVIAVFLLLREVIRRWFKDVPFFTYLLSAGMIITCGTYSHLIERADIYNVPIMAGTAFTALGLFFWLFALNRDQKPGACFFAGSLCMAMVVGCRPQMFLFSFLAFPLLWNYVLKERKLFSKTSLGNTLCITLPYFLIAALLMYYNYARFGSPLDFGATYSMTSNDMNLRGISIERMLHGCFSFLFLPMNINGIFPFLQSCEIESSFMGKLITEFFFGGIITCHMLTWVLFISGFLKKELKSKHLCAFLLTALFASFMIGLLDANQAGVLQRYSADLAWGIFFSAAILLFTLMEKLYRSSAYRYGVCFITIGFVLQLIYAFMVVFAPMGGIYIQKYNPELYYRAASLFHF